MAAPDKSRIRYGIFLRPHASLCWAVSQTTRALESQYGLRSSNAFPPHVTLVGNVAIADKGDAIQKLCSSLSILASRTPQILLEAAPPVLRKGALVLDVSCDAGRQPHLILNAFAAQVRDIVEPFATVTNDKQVVPFRESSFWAHISLASHDLVVQPSLAQEVKEYVDELGILFPAASIAGWITVCKFEADWSSDWWGHLDWELICSLRLEG